MQRKRLSPMAVLSEETLLGDSYDVSRASVCGSITKRGS